MIGRLLCWLGWHQWIEMFYPWATCGTGQPTIYHLDKCRLCWRCGKKTPRHTLRTVEWPD